MKNKNKKQASRRLTIATKPKRTKNKTTEPGIMGQILRGLGSLGGGAIGGFVGNPAAGATMGQQAGAALSRWLGAGDYEVKQNSLLRSSGSIPMMHNTHQGVIVRHREYLGDVKSSQAFTVQQTYPLQPGMDATFPWLSEIAGSFQEYTIRGMIFHYVPTSGDAVSSTNNALGSVMINTSYRSTALAPTSKVVLLNEFFSSDARPSECFVHPIECDPKENPYNVQYVRTTGVPAGEDPKSYDLGTTYVSTQGMQADNIVVGEMWATYEVELRKPRAANAASATYRGYASSNNNATSTSGTSLATALNTLAQDRIGLTITGTATAITISFPKGSAGTWAVALTGIATNNTNWVAPTFVNCAADALWPYSGANNANTSSSYAVSFSVKISDPSLVATVTYTQSAWANVGNSVLQVTPFPLLV